MSSPCLYDPLLVAQMVENLHAMQETQVRSLGREDPLEKGECLPTPGFLSGEVRGQRSLTGYSPGGLKESDMTEQLTHIHFYIFLNTQVGDEETASRERGPVLMQRIWGSERVARETEVDGELIQVREDGAGKGYLRTPPVWGRGKS